MHRLEVLIEENVSGLLRSVEVVADVPLSALVPALVEELKLPRTDLFGKTLIYMLRQPAGGRILPEHSTLLASGVAPGERLVLDAHAPDEPVVAQNSQQINQYVPPRDSDFHSSVTIADMDSFLAAGRKDTSRVLPPLQKERKWTRRAFLIAGGVLLGAAGSAVGYAAYNGDLTNLVNSLTPQTGLSTTGTQPQAATQPPPGLPKMAKPQVAFLHHMQTVRSVAWSPDGTLLASGADDRQLFIWGTDGAIRLDIEHPNAVHALAWSPDGQRLVTGSGTQVTFLNALNGTTLARSERRHTQMVTSLAWTPHGQMQVVSGAEDRRAIVWNGTTYRAMTTFKLHTSPIDVVTWSADGQTVASASQGGAVRVWSAADGKEVHGFYQDANLPMRALAFAPTGTQLAVGGDDGIVRLWNGLTCQVQQARDENAQCMDVPQRIQVSKQAIRSLAWSPDGRLLAVGADDGVMSIWNSAQLQKPLLTVPQNAAIHSLAWSPDSKQLASASGNTVTLWQIVA